MTKKVLVFTKRVLPRSNTFVAAQSTHLPSIEPIFIGFGSDSGGLDLIKGKETCLLSDSTAYPKIAKLIMETTQRPPQSWVSALKEKNANLIHAHFGKGGFYCSVLAKALNLPLITTFHGSDITQKDKLSYNQRHRNIVFNDSQKILAVSHFIRDKLIQRGCPSEKIIQHYTGIDNLFFSGSAQKSEIPTILFVGRLIEQKGCHFLLQAMKLIQKKLPDAKLLIAGYGVEEKNLKTLAPTLNHVHFLGPQNKQQIKYLMQDAWLTCFPSIIMGRGNEEGLSTVCLESQAMGTPIIGFNTGGVGEAVEHGTTGILVEQKNIQALSASILEVLLNDRFRLDLADEGIKRVDRLFNIKKQCARLEDIYLSLL